jgi:hypothetical protein
MLELDIDVTNVFEKNMKDLIEWSLSKSSSLSKNIEPILEGNGEKMTEASSLVHLAEIVVNPNKSVKDFIEKGICHFF